MRKILITGASGFVGSFLVEEALKRNLTVYAGVRKRSSRQYLQDPRILFFENDFNNVKTLTQNLASENFDYCIHNAGATSVKKKGDFFTVNTEYTKRLIQALYDSGSSINKFCFISSLAALGPADFTEANIITDHSSPHPVTTYGKSKLEAEKYIRKNCSLPYNIIRPTAVFGPRDKEFLPVFKSIKMGFALTVGSTTQWLSLIYVKDLARLVLDATLSSKINKSYLASDGNLYNAKSFNQNIAKALNKSIISRSIPITAVKVIAGISQFASRFTGKSTVLNLEKVNELKARNWNCDINPIREDFQFKAQYSLEEAIRETSDWYLENDWL